MTKFRSPQTWLEAHDIACEAERHQRETEAMRRATSGAIQQRAFMGATSPAIGGQAGAGDDWLIRIVQPPGWGAGGQPVVAAELVPEPPQPYGFSLPDTLDCGHAAKDVRYNCA